MTKNRDDARRSQAQASSTQASSTQASHEELLMLADRAQAISEQLRGLLEEQQQIIGELHRKVEALQVKQNPNAPQSQASQPSDPLKAVYGGLSEDKIKQLLALDGQISNLLGEARQEQGRLIYSWKGHDICELWGNGNGLVVSFNIQGAPGAASRAEGRLSATRGRPRAGYRRYLLSSNSDHHAVIDMVIELRKAAES